MFNFIFNNLNTISKPSLLFKINLWCFTNVSFFKNKFTNNILYFIEHFSNLKLKSIKLYYDFSDFEYFYNFFIKNIFFIILLLCIII